MACNPSRRSFLASAGALLGVAGAGSPVAAGLLRTSDRPWMSRERATWAPSEALIERMPELMRLAVVPAVSIAVVENGEITFARAFGVRNATTGEPADATTVFEAASLSKPTVAFVAMTLYDSGALDIDRPLVEYVRPTHEMSDPRARLITARHVMSQSSGMRNWRRPNDSEFDLAFEPGTHYLYSGEGFVWLARALEMITGTGFVRLMRERLFDPLGLEATTFLWNPSLETRMATGHNQRGEPTPSSMHIPMARKHHEMAARQNRAAEDWMWDDLVAAAREVDPSRTPMPGGLIPNAAASLLATPSDYARFTALLLDSPPAVPALSAESRILMGTRRTTVEPPLFWGLGVALEERRDARYVWHWGNNGDFHSYVLGDIAGRRAVTVFTNATAGPKVYQRVVRDIVGFDPASLVWI